MKPTATKTRGNVARQTRASFQEEINIAIKTPTNMKIDCTIVATVCCMDCPKVSTSLVSLDMMSPAEEESKYFKGMLLILAIISLLSCSVYLIATVVNTIPEIKEEIEDKDSIEMWLTGVANRKVEIKDIKLLELNNNYEIAKEVMDDAISDERIILLCKKCVLKLLTLHNYCV